jgi:hypothetical protein
MRHSRAHKGLFWLFFLGVLTQRLALPGASPIPAALPIYLAAAALLYAQRGLAIKRNVLISTIAVMCLLIVVCVLTGRDFSINSLVYLIVLYLPLSLGAPEAAELEPEPEPKPEPTYDGELKWFSTMMCVFAIVAIWQFASQVILKIPYSDPLSVLPEWIKIPNYEISYPIEYRSSIYKSNAYLFLEPSFLSQFLALALLIEIVVYRRVVAMGLQMAAIACTFSGTGILLLAFTLPLVILGNLRDRRVVALAGVAAVIMVGAVMSNSAVSERIAEWGARDSSASIRFSVPYQRLAELSFNNLSSLLTGYGAGAADRLKVDDQLANFPAIPKALIEYGVLGGVPLLTLIALRIFAGIRNFPIAVGLFCMQFFLSGALLQPISVFLLFYFLYLRTGPVVPRRARPICRPTPDSAYAQTSAGFSTPSATETL